MRRHRAGALAAVLAVLIGVAGCGGGGTTTINGKAVPTDPKAVCKLFADQSKDDGSDDSFTEKDYQEFISWADHVKDDAMSKDLRALATIIKKMPSGDSSSSDGSNDGSMAAAFEALSVYSSLTSDCAKYGVKLPDLMDNSSDSSDSPSASASEDPPIAFGQTKTFEDGLSVTVGVPVEFKPSSSAGTSKAPTYVKFQVTLHNGTGATFDPSSFSTSLQSGSTDEDEVYDSGKGIGNTPDTKLLDGRDATFWIGYGVEDTADLVLDVSVDFDRTDVIFTNAP